MRKLVILTLLELNSESMKRISIIVFLCITSQWVLMAQDSMRTVGKSRINGELVTLMVDEKGDTMLVADNLMEVSLTSPRTFKSREDYLRYRKYLRYAAIVYPYAKEAIKIFNEVEYATNNMKKGERKKYIRKLSKDLKQEFEAPLKKLTKTQGFIMTKMIERELNKSMHQLLKDTRGGFSAGYWNTMSKFWGYQLKDKYTEGDDEILDAVLKDFDISYKGKLSKK